MQEEEATNEEQTADIDQSDQPHIPPEESSQPPTAAGDGNVAPMSPKISANKQKIDIFLKPTGNTPIMKQKKWSVDPDKKICWVANFIRRYLKMDNNTPLFIYVNQAFAPAPDQNLQNLYDCFESDGKLVLHYCNTQAWG